MQEHTFKCIHFLERGLKNYIVETGRNGEEEQRNKMKKQGMTKGRRWKKRHEEKDTRKETERNYIYRL